MQKIEFRRVPFSDPAVQALLAEWNDELGFVPKGGVTVETADFDPPSGVFLLAFADGSPAGCAGLRRLSPTIGEVKRLFVRRAVRGRGIGGAVLDALERWAKTLGVDELRLDTDGGNPAALALFRSFSYKPIDDYNGNVYARYWFAKRLCGGFDAGDKP